VPSSGMVTAGPTITFPSGTHDVSLFGTASALNVYYVTGGAPQTLTQRTGDCTGACSALSTTSGVVTFTGVPSNFSTDSRSNPAVLSWEEGPTGSRSARAIRINSSTPVDVGNGTRRPMSLQFPGSSGPVVFFDTEGSTNAVFRRAFCTF
jgi:hypothetical protein